MPEAFEAGSPIDQSLAELESLKLEREQERITIPEPGSPEWEEIRRQDQEWGERLKPLLLGLEVTELIEPSGGEGRSLDEEKQLFLDSLDDESSTLNPTFAYPNLEGFDIDATETQLTQLREEIKKAEQEQTASPIIIKLYHYKVNEELAKVRWLQAVRDSNDGHAFHYANFIYGPLRDDHIQLAHQKYEEMMGRVGQDEDKSWKEGYKDLEAKQYGPEEVREFFRAVLKEYGIEDWKIEITDEVSSITEQPKHKDGPRLAIPSKRDPVSARKLLELSAHEIEAHALGIINGSLSDLLILSGDIQPDRSEDVKEGKAVIRQKQSLREIFGPNYPEAGGEPWYILAMEQVRNGANFRDTFLAVERLRYEYELKKAKGDEGKARDKARTQTWKTCRRVFRSVSDLSQGGRFFPKDKAYLSGERDVRQVVDSSHSAWLDIGETNLRILPELFQLGVDPKNTKYPYKNATKIVWERTLAAKHKA